MTVHAKLSPSKRHRWAKCPGSIREEAKYPEPPSGAAAIDGTHSHTLLEKCIKNNLANPESFIGVELTDGEGSFVVDKDRAERVKLAIDYIKIRSCNGILKVISEQRVDPQSLLGRDDLSGTVDCQIIGSDWIELIDYKDGMGVVSAENNLQLEQYAYGVLSQIGLNTREDYPVENIKNIIMTIVQPKLRLKGLTGISSAVVPVTSLLERAKEIILQAEATEHPDAPLVPGEDQCKYCPAKGGCSALTNQALQQSGIVFNPVDNLDLSHQSANKTPETMTNDQLRQVIEAIPLLKQMIEGAEQEALRRIQSGQTIKGLKLVNGKGSRSWSLPEEQMADKLVKMGIPKSAIYKTQLVSPAQAEKLTWEKKDGTKMQLSDKQLKLMETEYVTKLAGKLTVVCDSDSRPAVITDVSSMFQSVQSPSFTESLPSWLS